MLVEILILILVMALVYWIAKMLLPDPVPVILLVVILILWLAENEGVFK